MSSTTNVLITGVGRGLGREILRTYLARPNHTVIGSIRDLSAPVASDLHKIDLAEGSRLVLVKIESASLTDPAEVVRQLQVEGIDTLHVVIANAGAIGMRGKLADADLEAAKETFDINTFGPAALFIATRPLLEKAENPKWVSISTALASLGGLGATVAWPSFAYGASKTALNFVTQSIHVWHDRIIALSVHPGFVDTDMGSESVKFFGLPDGSAMPVQSSVRDVIKIVDNATKAGHSGKFFNHDGTSIQW